MGNNLQQHRERKENLPENKKNNLRDPKRSKIK